MDLPIANSHSRKLKQPKSIVISTNIYYKPIYETVLTMGIPGIVSTDFEEEFMRRIRIYFEAMDLSAPTLDEVKPAYDRFISGSYTFPNLNNLAG